MSTQRLTIGVSAATSRHRFIRLIAFLSVIGGSIFLRTELFAQQKQEEEIAQQNKRKK